MGAQATVIRDFERGDINAVAQLFQRTFRKNGAKAASPSLLQCIETSFFEHPWKDTGIRSKVASDLAGNVSGFIGILPALMELNDRPVLAAFAGSMMVDDPKADPLAGARLLRAFLAGPQELSLTETANTTALGMWQKLGHPLDAGYSMSWMRPLRPASTALQLAEHSISPMRLLRPFGRIADRAISFVRRPSFGSGEGRRLEFRDVGSQEFATALLSLKDIYRLRPVWNADTLDWFIGQAENKRNFGYPEWRVAYGPDGRPVAAYAYFARVGGIAWVLQALAVPGRTGELVDDLFEHAYAYGCAAIRGAAHPWLLPALMQRRAIFVGRAFYLAHARDKSLLEPIRDGQALASGLAGESWMRLIGDRFDD